MTAKDAFQTWVESQQARFPAAPQPVFIAAVNAFEAYKAATAIVQTLPPPERSTNAFLAEMTRLVSDLESEIKADAADKAALRRQIEVLAKEKADLCAEVESLKEDLKEFETDEIEEDSEEAEEPATPQQDHASNGQEQI